MKNREIDQDIVGIAFLKDKKLLIVQSAKSARNNSYTLVGGGVEKGERILEAAIRECHEEVDNALKINENDFEFLTSYQEPAASDPNLFIKMNVYLANKNIDGIVNCNPEIISYKWYQMGDSENVSSSIKEHFLPFAIKNKLMDSTYYEELVLNYLNDEVIFEMVLPSNYYRAKKMSLYSNEVYTKGAGVRLGNMGETKTNEKNPSILFNKDADEIIKKYNIEITKEPDRLVVKGTFKKSDEVQIILDNIFKNKTYNMVISNKPYTALCVDLNKKNKGKKINAYKYINDVGLNGKYYIYMKINGKVYDLDRYIEIK